MGRRLLGSYSVLSFSFVAGLAACSSNPTTPNAASGSSGSAGSAAGSNTTSGSSNAASSTGGTGSTGAAGTAGKPSGSGGQTGAAGSAGQDAGTKPSSGKMTGPPNGPYTTSGAQILDKDGKPHLFRGANIPSLEWSCAGEMSSLDYQELAGWGANAVRIPLNQDCWLNDASNPTYYPTYASIVDNQVMQAQSSGLDVILDLHWSDQGSYATGAACKAGKNGCQQDMADAHSVLFWAQLAAVYKSNPGVLFELYNEPRVASWSTWLNGGTSSGYAVVGMQTLYNTVRAAGTNNLIVVGGIDWSYDLRGVETTPVVGSNIIYNTHPYQDKNQSNPSGWNNYFGNLTATYPVIATEFGDHSSGQTGTCNAGFDATLIPYMDGKSTSGSNPKAPMSWTAWAFYNSTCSFPSLLLDSNYTPNAPGLLVKQELTQGL